MDIAKFIVDNFTERVWIGILVAGLVVVGVAYLWLALRAVKTSKWWLIGFVPPLALLYLFAGSRRVVAPLLLMLLGGVLAATPLVATRYLMPLLPLQSHEADVDGKLHVTLTDKLDFDYATLRNRPQIAVLQMANPNVNDETLVHLAPLVDLEELDVSNSKITDAGLAKLKAFPKLRTLRLAHVRTFTDEGFKEHIAPLDNLLILNVSDTNVKSGTLRAWKKANKDRDGI